MPVSSHLEARFFFLSSSMSAAWMVLLQKNPKGLKLSTVMRCGVVTIIDVVAGVVGAPVASGDAVSTADQSFSVILEVAAT